MLQYSDTRSRMDVNTFRPAMRNFNKVSYNPDGKHCMTSGSVARAVTFCSNTGCRDWQAKFQQHKYHLVPLSGCHNRVINARQCMLRNTAKEKQTQKLTKTSLRSLHVLLLRKMSLSRYCNTQKYIKLSEYTGTR